MSSMNAFGIDSKRNILKNYLISSSIYASIKDMQKKYVKKLGIKIALKLLSLGYPRSMEIIKEQVKK